MPKQISPKDIKAAQDAWRDNTLVRIATASKNGRPHSSTLLFIPTENFGFYFITRDATAKTKNLAENPWLSASLGDGPPISFQAFGRARLVRGAKEKTAVMELWAEKAADLKEIWPPIFRLKQTSYAIYHFKPSRVTVIDLRRQNLAGGNSLFMRVV